jgi:hypothetical protein
MSDKEITMILRLTRLKLAIWPTNHYAWFELREFEDDTERINEACDKLMTELQAIISNKNFETTELEKDMARQFSSESVLKRNILLNPTLKPLYDDAIRREREFLKQARAQYATTSPYQPKTISPTTANQSEPAAPPEIATPIIRQIAAKKPAGPPKIITAVNRDFAAKKPAARVLEAIKQKQARRHKQIIRNRILLLMAAIASGIAMGYVLLRTQF